MRASSSFMAIWAFMATRGQITRGRLNSQELSIWSQAYGNASATHPWSIMHTATALAERQRQDKRPWSLLTTNSIPPNLLALSWPRRLTIAHHALPLQYDLRCVQGRCPTRAAVDRVLYSNESRRDPASVYAGRDVTGVHFSPPGLAKAPHYPFTCIQAVSSYLAATQSCRA
jgi:hypothetical protein